MTTSRVFEYWIVQNTGWSEGSSWFDTGGSPTHPLRLSSEEQALAHAARAQAMLSDESVLWRLVHVRIETSAEQRTTTETFRPLDPWPAARKV